MKINRVSEFQKIIYFAIVLFTSLLFPFTLYANERTRIHIAHIDGAIGVAMEEHVKDVFKSVGNDPQSILIFTLNTPGGLVDSMASIVSQIVNSPLPVVVWVGPSGARSASAGAFIVQAAHIASMAPETHIGAAHPVNASGKDIDNEAMQQKVLNDLSAKMRSLAQERSRDEKALLSMVKTSVSFTAREAFNMGVIDFIASTESELIRKLNGKTIIIKGKENKIKISDPEIINVPVSIRLQILQILTRPDIAYLAFIAGVMALILEFKTAGGFYLGTTGIILLLISAYGFRVLPFNFAGIVFLLSGIFIILADILVGGVGILALIGIASMFFGSLILFDVPGEIFLHFSLTTIWGITAIFVALFVLILRVIYKSQKTIIISGEQGMIGAIGKVVQVSEAGNVMVFLKGEYWNAEYDGSSIPHVGDKVIVTSVLGLTLNVNILHPTAQCDTLGTDCVHNMEKKTRK